MGRPHGLDGSFYVSHPTPRLLQEGVIVSIGGVRSAIVRRAGTDERPIVRLERTRSRAQAEALRGSALTVDRGQAPPLGQDEWWAVDLQGCTVVDGERRVGVVRGLLELPSCEALEVDTGAVGPERPNATGPSEESGRRRASRGSAVLVPMVRDAIRRVDLAAGTIDVDMSFVEGQ